jgi:hypothetical protein
VAPTQMLFDLQDAFAEPGCPVCRLTLTAVSRYIATVDYELANDPEYRERILPAWGFCSLHAHQWLREGHILGVALVYGHVLHNVRPVINDAGSRATWRPLRSRRENRLRPTDRCRICTHRDEVERSIVVTLGEGLAGSDAEFSTAFARSDGLCLSHLRLALDILSDAAVSAKLREATLNHQERLAGHLREIVRKHDYRFREEPSGEERGAAVRVVEHVVGLPGIGDGGE